MVKRILICSVTMMVLACILYTHVLSISINPDYYQASEEQFYYTVDICTMFGNFYDTNYNLLVNEDIQYIAVVNPTDEAITEIYDYVVDIDELNEKLSKGVPFSIEVIKDSFTSDDIMTYTVPKRYSDNQLAKHLIGYTKDGQGVSGLELSYNDFLHESETTYSVKFAKDGLGNILKGIEPRTSSMDRITQGVVTTLDSDIQSICEDVMKDVSMGACLVTDVYTGEIKAMVSMPTFDLDNLEDALYDKNMPFINRTLYEYSCGSIFKLVTAGAALESGIDESFEYDCTGEIDILTQTFKCHQLDGHGIQDMQTAMKNSCNTYFIELSKSVSNDILLDICDKIGFGRELILAKNVTSSKGYVPNESQLNIPAEKANFSFGQGLLTVTPIQISSLTCAIANNGNMPILYVVKGKTDDGYTLYDTREPMYTRVFSEKTAQKLRQFMEAAVQYNSLSNGIPSNTTAAGKTSTAQTGKYNEDGTEICQSWITGYFPCDSPKYAVTVLVENGDYGNISCAPLFKEIIETITDMGL